MLVKCLVYLLCAMALGFVAPVNASSPLTAASNSAPSAATFPVLVLDQDGPQRLDVGTRMGLLVDSSQTLELDQVRTSTQDWQPIARQSPNFGFTTDVYWFRFHLQNNSGKVLSRSIELPIPFLDHVRLYHLVGQTLQTQYSLGDEQPFAQRAVRNRNFIMPLQLAPGSNEIYLRLASSGTIEAPLRVWDPVFYQEASIDENLMQGGVIGILLIMLVYNLFVYFSTRDVNYLYYIGFVASYLLFHLTLTGYTFAYLWPNAVGWNGIAISVFAASAALFTCLFTDSFLKLRSFSRSGSNVVRFLAVGSAAMLVASFMVP